MKLIVFGDSFPAGQIKDPPNPRDSWETTSFGYHLFQKSKIFTEYENFANPGDGNECIVYQIHKYIQNNNDLDKCFFLICWTGVTRDSLYDIKKDRYSNCHAVINKPIYPKNTIDYIFRTDHLILSVLQILNWYNIKYVMTSSFNNILQDSNFFTVDNIKKHDINWIWPDRPNNSLFDIITNDWRRTVKRENQINHITNRKNSKIANCMHPTTYGHEYIANTILEEVERYT